MNMYQTIKAYRALSKSDRRFISSQQIKGEYTAAQWLNQLSRLARYDSELDKLRFTLEIISWLSVLFLFLGVFFIVFIVPVFPIMTIIGLGMVVLFVTILITSLIFNLSLKTKDIDNRLREPVLPLLTLLSEDSKQNSRVRVKLDLTGSLDNQKMLSKVKVQKTLPKIVESHYRDPWFEAYMQLCDDSQLRFEITTYVRKRDITKRNQRGNKTKHVTKYKVRHAITCSLRYKNEQYQLRGPLPDNVRQKEGSKRNALNSKSIVELKISDPMDLVNLEDKLTSRPDLEDILAAVNLLFQQLKPKAA